MYCIDTTFRPPRLKAADKQRVNLAWIKPADGRLGNGECAWRF